MPRWSLDKAQVPLSTIGLSLDCSLFIFSLFLNFPFFYLNSSFNSFLFSFQQLRHFWTTILPTKRERKGREKKEEKKRRRKWKERQKEMKNEVTKLCWLKSWEKKKNWTMLGGKIKLHNYKRMKDQLYFSRRKQADEILLNRWPVIWSGEFIFQVRFEGFIFLGFEILRFDIYCTSEIN